MISSADALRVDALEPLDHPVAARPRERQLVALDRKIGKRILGARQRHRGTYVDVSSTSASQGTVARAISSAASLESNSASR